jgi:hypothetical protein
MHACRAFEVAEPEEGSTVRVRPPGEAGELVSDVLDKTRNVLVEAKGTRPRGEVRMAIGQLLDYRRFIHPDAEMRPTPAGSAAGVHRAALGSRPNCRQEGRPRQMLYAGLDIHNACGVRLFDFACNRRM